jgi:hypothetical protein
MNFSWRTKCNLCKRDKVDCEVRRENSRSRSQDRRKSPMSPVKEEKSLRHSLSPKLEKKRNNRGDSMEELFSSKSSSRERQSKNDRAKSRNNNKSLSRSLSPVTNKVLRQDDDYYKRFGGEIH